MRTKAEEFAYAEALEEAARIVGGHWLCAGIRVDQKMQAEASAKSIKSYAIAARMRAAGMTESSYGDSGRSRVSVFKDKVHAALMEVRASAIILQSLLEEEPV